MMGSPRDILLYENDISASGSAHIYEFEDDASMYSPISNQLYFQMMDRNGKL